MQQEIFKNETNRLLKIIERRETRYVDSDEKSGDMYQILVDKGLKDEIAPELRDLRQDESLVVEYRKWVRAAETEYDFSASIMKYEDGGYKIQRGAENLGNAEKLAMDIVNLMENGGDGTYRTDKLRDNDTGRDLKARIRSLVAEYEREPVQAKKSAEKKEDVATNFVLEKLKNAGIEVVADKDEFNRILEAEKLLQKMVEGGANPEKIERQKQRINGLIVSQEPLELSEDNIANAFRQLDRSLRFNANFEIQSERLGEEVSVFPGSTGKHGLGIRHIIEERTKKDNLSLDEITALSALIVDAVQTGDITRNGENRCEISKSGIIAIVRKDFDDKHQNWILTGFHYEGENIEKKQEATETIQTVIAKYGQSPDYSYFRSQVGAVVASLDLSISQTPTKSSGVSKIASQSNETAVKDNAISVTSLKTETINKRASILCPSDTYSLLSHVKNEEQEHFGVILLDAAHNVKAVNTVSVGTINKSLVHQREVFSEAVRAKAAEIIVFHNHPSGNPFPSDEDLNATRALLKASEVVGIPILDHLIVAESSYYSFLEHDILDDLRRGTEFLIKDNQTYGFTHNGKVYLNPEIMNSNAAVHEYTHLWDKYTQNSNPELWERGKEILSKTHLWSEVKADPNYADISNDDDLILSEVHSRICGRVAQQVLERIAREDGEIARDRAIDWDREVWEYLSSEFLTAEDKEILFEGQHTKEQINEFISLSLKDLMEEKEIALFQSMEQSKDAALELKSDSPKERVREITSQLEKGVKDLFESKKYKEYLDVMSKFHRYSANNLQLIALQNPNATQVAGFQTWKKDFERYVKKGEKGIKILVPVVYKKKAKEREKILEEDTGIEGEDEEHLTFKIGHVFDVSQTAGKALPSLGADELSGAVERYSEIYSALERLSPYPIYFEDIKSGAKGYCSFSDKKIAVKNGMSEAQTIKTIVHEISHARLHENGVLDKRTAEVQAESVSYTVCKHFGLDTSDYSFAYVTGWSSGKETRELKESLELIRRTSVEFIEGIEKTVSKKISQEKTGEEMTNILQEPKVEINGEMTESLPLLNENRWIDGREMPVWIVANAIDYINEKTGYPADKIADIDSIPEEVRKYAISVALKNHIKDGEYSYLLDSKSNLRQEAFDREVVRLDSNFKDTAKLMFETLVGEFSAEKTKILQEEWQPYTNTKSEIKSREDLGAGQKNAKEIPITNAEAKPVPEMPSIKNSAKNTHPSSSATEMKPRAKSGHAELVIGKKENPKNTSAEKSPYDGIEFFERYGIPAAQEFANYANRHKSSEKLPDITKEEAHAILANLETDPKNETVRLGLRQGHLLLEKITRNTRSGKADVSEISVSEAMAFANENAKKNVENARRQNEVFLQSENKQEYLLYIGNLYEQNVQKTEKDARLLENLKNVFIDFKGIDTNEISEGDIISDATAKNVMKIADGVFQLSLVPIGVKDDANAVGNNFALSAKIAEQISPEVKKYGEFRDNFFILDDKRADPYLMKELIDKRLCEPPKYDPNYYREISEYTKNKPIRYLALKPNTAANFKENLQIIARIDGNISNDSIAHAQKLISLADRENRFTINKFLENEGCKDAESTKEIFSRWCSECREPPPKKTEQSKGVSR